jgi:hypothetical protein
MMPASLPGATSSHTSQRILRKSDTLNRTNLAKVEKKTVKSLDGQEKIH